MDQDAANEDIAQMAKTDGSTEILCTSRHKDWSINYIIADGGGEISEMITVLHRIRGG